MSSKRRLRRRSCGIKVRHKTAQKAYVQIISLRRSGKCSGSLAVYHCKFCGGWHVGRLNKRDRRAMAARRAN